MMQADLLSGPSIGQQRHHHSVGPGGAALRAMGQIDCTEMARSAPPDSTDLLGFQDSPQQQEHTTQHLQYSPSRGETTYINASTVAISTSGTPTIVGLGKIEPSTAAANANNNYSNNKPKRKVIFVPTYSCNGGLDTKFNPIPRYARPSSLHNLLTPEEYEVAIQTLNDKIKRSRAKKLDYVLLGTGPLLVPLALWGARHGRQVKQRRKLIEEGVWEFNERMQMEGKNVKMEWNRSKYTGGAESYLTIEEAEGVQSGKKVD
ncbi:hypothetical protein QTG54_012529 [Skeletonema marinoi]|uniref:Uncharacterized protein n=1 Tax=Skeletonema marinoi TaxID=267567 RepID=A0AAD8XZZ3_9STRA|nr:hypothetical protein QTG54_012529 [Skeletonema marinoi]